MVRVVRAMLWMDNIAGNFAATIQNDGGNSNRHVLRLIGGQDANPSNIMIQFVDGDESTQVGRIEGDGAGGVNYNSGSDERQKQDIEPLVLSLDKILALRPVEYRGRGADRSKGKTPGFVAQEVMGVIPEAAVYDEEEDIYLVSWNKFIPFMWGAIQELNAKVEELL